MATEQQDDFMDPNTPFDLQPQEEDGLSPIYPGARTRTPNALPGSGQPINTAMGDFEAPDAGTGYPDPSPPPPTVDMGGQPPAAPDAAPVPREAQHGGSSDPATGEHGPPTGPPPGTNYFPPPAGGAGDYSGIQSILEKMMAGQESDRAAVAAQRASLQSTLDRIIKGAERPVASTDTEIAGPTTAFNAQGQRARRLMQEQLAQQAAATGQTTGSVDSAVERSFEDLGNATGTYQGGLMVNELKGRRDQLQAALMTGAGLLSSQDQSRIQEELDALNGQMSMINSKNQNSQFYDRLGFDMGHESNTLDEILAKMMSEGGGSLSA
jgi:hypothetical protein